jgi:1-acyl-sn-glycerol-3-phosphate acyltransferase
MKLSQIILKAAGWKVIGIFPKEIKKAVVIAAPHTSNWDFFLGFFAYKVLGISAKFLVKKEAFFFPMGILLKAMGGISIDRSPGNSVVDQVVEEMKNTDNFILTIAPEGTRSPVQEWKTGFWRIAKQARVPVFLGKIDFQSKTIGLIQKFDLSDNFDTDIKTIRTYYKKEWAIKPEGFVEI